MFKLLSYFKITAHYNIYCPRSSAVIFSNQFIILLVWLLIKPCSIPSGPLTWTWTYWSRPWPWPPTGPWPCGSTTCRSHGPSLPRRLLASVGSFRAVLALLFPSRNSSDTSPASLATSCRCKCSVMTPLCLARFLHWQGRKRTNLATSWRSGARSGSSW